MVSGCAAAVGVAMIVTMLVTMIAAASRTH
jgi:hypothetical protein